jgi:hypothetical protein
VSEIPQAECEALVALYNSTNGAAWYRNAGWLDETSACTWDGVTCGHGHVSWLDLPSNGLSGALPTAAWSELPYLDGLDLSDNALQGTIPPELGTLDRLRFLWLSFNQLTGTIPGELGNLTDLRFLVLNDNQISGTIPAGLGDLHSLNFLQLGGNQLSGSIPPALGELTQLTNLHLGRNQLSGALPPALGNLTNLRWLRLRANRFTGTIPAEFGNLISLENLALDGNLMSGPIPSSFTSLTGLTYLTLSCGLTADDPGVIAFLDLKVPGWEAALCLNTDVGENVSIMPEAYLTIRFDSVTQAGFTTVQPSTDPISVPGNFQLIGNAYEVTSGSEFGEAQVCFTYDAGLTSEQESAVRLLHLENGLWTDVTDPGYPNTVTNQVCGTVSDFSPFAIALQLNTPPSDVVITTPFDPQRIGTNVQVRAAFNDPDQGDAHTALWVWGDDKSDLLAADGLTAEATHAYAAPGVYTVSATITDEAGGSASAASEFVVIYDPDGGFVTGGGWIESPPGAYVADSALIGKATFGFVSKYQKGANVPTGNTEFQFQVASLNFSSTSYEWLVVAGARAQYKGSGTINGSGDYGFILTAIDGQVNGGGGMDRFRLKIVYKGSGEVVYDNQLGAGEDALPSTAIQGGSIVVHK